MVNRVCCLSLTQERWGLSSAIFRRRFSELWCERVGLDDLRDDRQRRVGSELWAAKVVGCTEDVAHSKLVILWGINVLRSNSHLVPNLKEARKRGARIVHIDPYCNETSRFADENWQVVVGTDAALALAIGGEILRAGREDQEYLAAYANDLTEYKAACAQWPVERAAEYCGIEAAKIRELADAIGREKSTFIKVGYE